MAFQTGKNVLVAFKAESTFNTVPATVTGATQMRIMGGGLGLQKATIQSQEIRSDAQTALGRHGSRSVTGSYQCEMSTGSHDDLYQAVARATWATSTICAQANATSQFTCGTNTISHAGIDSFLATAGGGIKIGDVFRLSNYSTAANNDLNLRVKTLATNTITIFGTGILTAGVADATCTLTIFKKLTRPATPTKRTFYIEEYLQDIDLSAAYGGVRFISMKVNGTPDGMATVEFGALGASMTAMATGTSPIYTSPTLSTTSPLVFADAKLSYNGVDVATVTAFNMEYAITAKTEPVVGSSISPDVFDNDARLSGSLSFIRQDLANQTAFTNETAFDLHILLEANMAAPKDFIAFYVPNVKLTSVNDSLGGDGAMIEQCNFMAGMKEGFTATGYDNTMITIQTSAP